MTIVIFIVFDIKKSDINITPISLSLSIYSSISLLFTISFPLSLLLRTGTPFLPPSNGERYTKGGASSIIYNNSSTAELPGTIYPGTIQYEENRFGKPQKQIKNIRQGVGFPENFKKAVRVIQVRTQATRKNKRILKKDLLIGTKTKTKSINEKLQKKSACIVRVSRTRGQLHERTAAPCASSMPIAFHLLSCHPMRKPSRAQPVPCYPILTNHPMPMPSHDRVDTRSLARHSKLKIMPSHAKKKKSSAHPIP